MSGDGQGVGQHEGYVHFHISSNLNPSIVEKRFPSTTNIRDLKNKLELITGGSASSMKLKTSKLDGDALCDLEDDGQSLAQYNLSGELRLEVTDNQTASSITEEDVPKYDMSLTDYQKREESLRHFKMKNKLGQFNEELQSKKQQEKAEREKAEKQFLEKHKDNVGARCEVRVSGKFVKRGVVRFIGEVHFQPGVWVGVQYDEPVGKNNGSVEGKVYFECPPQYGSFVRPASLEIGDFPEIGLPDDDDGEM